MTTLILFSCALFITTLVLPYINWKIYTVTKALLAETILNQQDTRVMRGDTRRVADSFDISDVVSVPQTTEE